MGILRKLKFMDDGTASITSRSDFTERAVSTAATTSVAERMVKMTRQNPDQYNINVHKDEVKGQILAEAEAKRNEL